MPRNPQGPRQRLAPRLFTVDQYCDVTNKCRATAYNEMRRGETPYIIDGGRRTIPVDFVHNKLKTFTAAKGAAS